MLASVSAQCTLVPTAASGERQERRCCSGIHVVSTVELKSDGFLVAFGVHMCCHFQIVCGIKRSGSPQAQQPFG